jgi:hypothetical protein
VVFALVLALTTGRTGYWILAGLYAAFGVLQWYFPALGLRLPNPPNESTIQWMRKRRREK